MDGSHQQTAEEASEPSPQQMMAALNQLTATLVELTRQREEDREAYKTQFRALQDAVASTAGDVTPLSWPASVPAKQAGAGLAAAVSAAAATLAAPTVAQAPAAPPVRRARARLGEVTPFTGKKTEYRGWRVEMSAKLATDGEAIGSGQDQCAYLFSRLREDARTMATAYAEGNQHGFAPNTFLAYLDSVYLDPNEVTRSAERLRVLHQKQNESVAHFIPKFEALLMRSEMYVNDAAAIAHLRFALNDETRRALVGQPPAADYGTFKTRVLQIGSELEGLHWSRRGSPGDSQSRRGGGDSGWNGRLPAEPMDLRAGRTTSELTAKEPSEKRTCFRCSRKGHIVRDCPQVSAKKEKGPRVNKSGRAPRGTRTSDQESTSETDSTSSPSSSEPDSGKE